MGVPGPPSATASCLPSGFRGRHFEAGVASCVIGIRYSSVHGRFLYDGRDQADHLR